MVLSTLIIFMEMKLQGIKWIARWWYRWITIKQNSLKTNVATWIKVPFFQTTLDPTWPWTWHKTVVTFRQKWTSYLEPMEVDFRNNKAKIWVTAALSIWNQICTCHFKVRLNKRQITYSRRCKEQCMIKIKGRLNNKIIQLWILRILWIANKRVRLCCHMHQELNHNLNLLGLLKRRSNKRIKSGTCQCNNNKIEWLICQCQVKTKKDQLKNTSTVATLLWTTTPTLLKWCRTT